MCSFSRSCCSISCLSLGPDNERPFADGNREISRRMRHAMAFENESENVRIEYRTPSRQTPLGRGEPGKIDIPPQYEQRHPRLLRDHSQ
jgi:hypothetical protein